MKKEINYEEPMTLRSGFLHTSDFVRSRKHPRPYGRGFCSDKNAMEKLGITNFLTQIVLSVKWIINPNSAIELAKKIVSKDSSKNKKHSIIAVGYLNEFFSKYLEFGKSDTDIVLINEKIDKGVKSNNKIANALAKLRKIRLKISQSNPKSKDQVVKTTKNFGVSAGVATGTVLNIISPKQPISENSIGIFKTSGMKHTIQFTKCIGIIFLNGAVTSHGAIIAREFGIPAVVYPNLKIQNGKTVTINGNTGQIDV